MNSLSKLIGMGVGTFRIRDFDKHFSVLEDLGPDYPNFLESRKIVKLIEEDVLYALVQVPYKSMEEFVIRITDPKAIDWKEIVEKTKNCTWRGPQLDPRYIN